MLIITSHTQHRKIVHHADQFSPIEHMTFIYSGQKRTTVIVNLIDKWLTFCLKINCDVCRGGETVIWCWFCLFMLFWSARLVCDFCSQSDCYALLAEPAQATAGLKEDRDILKPPWWIWHKEFQPKRVAVSINVVPTLKKKRRKNGSETLWACWYTKLITDFT